MNISIEKKILADVVHTAARFSERKAGSLPALSSILVIAGDEGIKLRATNLETGVDLKLPGTCKNEGVVAIPASILSQITASLSGEGMVTLEQTGDTVVVITGTGKSSIKTVAYEDFPTIPFPEKPKNRLVLPGAVLKELFSAVAACASSSTIRPELASLLISIAGGTLTAVATDSFRLAEKKIALANKGVQGSFLIPAKNAIEIAQSLPDDEIIMSFDEHQCAFVSDAGMFVSRLTSAVYPDYRQIIPKESVAEANVLRKDFESALRRATVFADAFQKVTLSFEPKQKKLALFAKNADIGESADALPAAVSGSELKISFNHRYLAAVLSLTNAESFSLSAAGIGRPLVIKGVGDASLLYLVSPMNQ